ncbi:NAD(P)-binding protein [Pisolithus albus]|nr:NAD(P)-binding protein [Pisolithus albus]
MSKRNPNAIAGPRLTADEHYQRTVARIGQIQTHLDSLPRGQRLMDKTCIITGVGSLHGIGRATALLFAREGARHLYLLDFSAENLPELESTIRGLYPDVKVSVIQADAADDAAIAALCDQAIKEEGRLDVFFANAGIVHNKALQDLTADVFMDSIRVNSLSCFLAVKHGSRAMMHVDPSKGKTLSGGSIILTASVAGLRSGAGTIDYSASKAAVNSIAKTSVYQLQKTDIRVNSICPGLIETNMTKDMFDFARQRGTGGKLGQLNPLGRYGVPQEIAQMALFLATDESSYVNGQNIAIDGGLSASVPVIPGHWA